MTNHRKSRRILDGRDISLGGRITVDFFRAEPRGAISGGIVDAASVQILPYTAGPDFVLSQDPPLTASVKVGTSAPITLDLTRTTALNVSGSGGRNAILQGDFVAPTLSLSLGAGTGNTQINGNVTANGLGLGGGGTLTINGTLTANDAHLGAGTTMEAGTLIDIPRLALTLGSPATLSQVANIATFTSQPAGLPAKTLRFNKVEMVELVLFATPLTISTNFTLPSENSSLAFRKDTVTALGNLSVNGTLRLGLDEPANLVAAGAVGGRTILPSRQGSPIPINLTAGRLTADSGGIRFGGLPDTFRDDTPRPGASLNLTVTDGSAPLKFASTGAINGATFNGGGNGSKTGTFGGSGASTSAFDHPSTPPF